MNAEQIIRQLQSVLPLITNYFTTEIDVSNLSQSGNLVSAQTTAAHNLTSNDWVSMSGAIVRNSIVSSSISGRNVTYVTAIHHDLTLNYQLTVDITGANEAEFNGSFNLIGVPNRETFIIELPSLPISTPTGSIILLEDRPIFGYNGWRNINVTGPNTFTYTTDNSLEGQAHGDVKVRYAPRISGASTLDRAERSYTQQNNGDLWAYVVLGDPFVSKSRDIETDETTSFSAGTEEIRILKIYPFDIYVFAPTSNDLSGRLTRDTMEDISRFLYKAIVRYLPDSTYTEDQVKLITPTGDGIEADNESYYIHRFSFEVSSYITFCDVVGPDFNAAFRDINFNILNPNEEQDIVDLSVTVNLDEQPLNS